jgi:hypothetical protein
MGSSIQNTSRDGQLEEQEFLTKTFIEHRIAIWFDSEQNMIPEAYQSNAKLVDHFYMKSMEP